MAINTELNDLYHPSDAMFVHAKHKRRKALTQSMIWPGIELVGAMTEGDKVKNQVRYEIKAICDAGVRFTCGPPFAPWPGRRPHGPKLRADIRELLGNRV